MNVFCAVYMLAYLKSSGECLAKLHMGQLSSEVHKIFLKCVELDCFSVVWQSNM